MQSLVEISVLLFQSTDAPHDPLALAAVSAVDIEDVVPLTRKTLRTTTQKQDAPVPVAVAAPLSPRAESVRIAMVKFFDRNRWVRVSLLPLACKTMAARNLTFIRSTCTECAADSPASQAGQSRPDHEAVCTTTVSPGFGVRTAQVPRLRMTVVTRIVRLGWILLPTRFYFQLRLTLLPTCCGVDD